MSPPSHDHPAKRRARLPDFVGSLLAIEAIGGFLLTLALVAGVLWATLAASSYQSFVTASIHLPGVPTAIVHNTTTLVVNLVMLVFFGAIGLEVARERVAGDLAEAKTALTPIVAALLGMALAALIYLATIAIDGQRGALAGWGVPMATDVAFTLGALSLLGRGTSRQLRTFLLTLAVADDVASVMVLAVTAHNGSHHPVGITLGLVAGALGVIAAALLARRFLPSLVIFGFLALIMWWLFAQLGIEPTLAAIVVALFLPTGDNLALAGPRAERFLAPVSTFLVLPLFAIVVGGVDLATHPWRGSSGLVVAIVAARSIGKFLGIFGGVAVVTRFGLGQLPAKTTWGQLGGAALLCGIGFTVPLLFADAAFGNQPVYLEATKFALIVASLLCAVVGLGFMASTKAVGNGER
jgi:Na+:H+ antiporter, NhaA family